MQLRAERSAPPKKDGLDPPLQSCSRHCACAESYSHAQSQPCHFFEVRTALNVKCCIILNNNKYPVLAIPAGF